MNQLSPIRGSRDVQERIEEIQRKQAAHEQTEKLGSHHHWFGLVVYDFSPAPMASFPSHKIGLVESYWHITSLYTPEEHVGMVMNF